ncbi:MAG: hypothetical protein KCHDKBKB_02581 [Elusimicrobia bacterium]|nr:hypothetical protein [Elusimicrobiota bacterium]
MKLTKIFFSATLLALTSTASFAAYTINRTDGGNNTRLVQGREYTFLITNTNSPVRLEDVFIDMSTPNFDILVPPGVQTGPNKYSVDGSGQLVISIRFHNPGSYSMTVRNSQDSNNRGTLNGIQVQKYPVTFSITPNNPTVNANQDFFIDVTAIDSNGIVVTGYEDSVQITDSQLNQLVGFVNGSSFVNGTATNVAVKVKAGNLNNQFRLTLTGSNRYFDPVLPAPSLSAYPSLTSNLLNITPGAFNKLVLLFPGEILSPGVGKVGSVTAQQSGIPVSAVTVQRVDAWFNPINDNPSPAINIQFTSSQAGQDNPPFPFTMSMTGPLLSITSAMNQIYFGGSGDRIVKAIPDGDTTKEDSTLVPVNPGAAETFSIEIVGVAPNQTVVTETLMLVRIRAFDQNGQPLTTLFGQVPGAELRALLGSGQESRDWVDTNEPTLVPDNVVNFVGGVATMNLVVTKFGSDVRLHYVTPNREAFSIPFNVDVGAPNKVHFTIRGKSPNPTQGETWTPGTYPGNSGTPPVVKVGEEVVVEARITDRRWNLISGGGSSFTMQLTNTANHFVEARHMTLGGPTYQFPNNGEFSFSNDPSFDKSFRIKFRTAGPSASPLISAPQFSGTVSLGTFFSSTMTVNPEIFNKLVILAPGETLRPGIDTEVDGKTGTPLSQQAGIQFNMVAYATDQYFNPVINGPFPTVNFTLTPSLANSFVSGTLPSAMQGGQKSFTVTLASGTNVTLYQEGAPWITQSVSVPISHGPLDHFRMTLNALGSKEAGVPFSVTIRAEDQYNNTVLNFNQAITLSPNTGAGTMTPITVTLGNGVVTTDLTMFASTASARIQMSYGSVFSQSPNFAVQVNSQGYQRLLLLLPGESLVQGTATGKTGSPTPISVGLVSIARAIACDLYYNPLDTAGTVLLSSNHLVQFGSAQGDLANVDGHGEYATTLILKNATSHTITLRDVNNLTVSTSVSNIQGQVGTYRKLQILAPGESNNPDQSNGKSGTISEQKVATPFTLTINAVDDFWNVVNFNGGDTSLSASITSVMFNPPNNNGGATPRPFINGTTTRQAIVGEQGLVTLSVRDDANLTKTGQSVDVQVNPGPIYVFQTPVSAVAGQAFPAVTIRLEENGVPVAGYNQSVYLSADLVSGGPASGAFNPDGTPREYVMTNGVVTITDLSYAYVENIKIRLTDGFERLAFSDPIDVTPSGLKYRITVPSVSVIAGPPANFQVMVELLEQNTNTLIKNHDHAIDVEVISAVNATTDGNYTVTGANLSQGVATFAQSYTKAESVLIRASENAANGDPNFAIPSQNSNNVNIVSDGYKKLLLIAPGETHVPGVPSATGKTGITAARQKGVPFLVQIRGVDQYWNVAQSFDGGTIHLESNDLPASIGANNPVNQDAPLVNGESASFIRLDNPGNVTLTVRDSSNSNIGAQSVLLNVGGLYYRVDGIPAQEFAGPPTQFTMNVTLYDSNTNLPVTNANQSITLEPLHTNGSTATGSLGVVSSQLVNGTVGINDQSYSIPENIVIRVQDANGNSGTSSVINFISRQVRYVFETPTDADVNVPFNVNIKAIDQDTGAENKTLNRTNTLAAYSAVTGLPVTGTFVPGTVNIVNGVGTVACVYNVAEAIFLRMTDSTSALSQSPPTQATFSSQGTINVHPGSLANVDGIANFSMRSNETRDFTVRALDTFGNVIPGQRLVFGINSIDFPGQLFINGQEGNFSANVNSQGELVVSLRTSIDTNGNVELLISDGDRPNGHSKLITIDVKGLKRRPSKALGLGENRIPVNSRLALDINTTPGSGGTLRTYYRLDNGAWQIYDADTGIIGFTETRKYAVEWYSEVCYDAACSNPISEVSINGAPNFAEVTTYVLSSSISGYPSPFNPKGPEGENYLTIQYPLQTASSVEINIYDLFGQKVWHKDVNAGEEGGQAKEDNRVFWFGTNDDGRTVANGGYIVTVKVGGSGQVMKTKVLVVK